MGERLRLAHVDASEYTFTSDSRRKLFARLLDAVQTGTLKSAPHPLFRQELLTLQIEDRGGLGWRVDHRPGQNDDTVVAVSLGITALQQTPIGEAVTPALLEKEGAASFMRSMGVFVPLGGWDNVVEPDYVTDEPLGFGDGW